MSLKNIATLCMFLLTTTVAVWLINWPPSRSIETLVTNTHKQISNLNIDVQTRLTGRKKAPKDNINLDSYHLELLGFSDSPRLYPQSASTNVVLPVIVTVATVNNYERTIKLVDSVQRYFTNHTVVIYDLRLGSYELVKLKKRCNSSDVCVIQLLDYLKFPSHLKDEYMHAYQPIVIQEALNTYGAVIWISADSEDYFQTSEMTDVLQLAERVGIAAWTLESMDPTSTFTHPGMFTHFALKPSSYHFVHMVRSSHLVVYNTARVHYDIMRPWVQCALVAKCVSPAGADSGSCVLRRPRFKYSGCHNYAESALNVVLGLAFNFEDAEYTLTNFSAVFGVEETTSTSQTPSTTPTRRTIPAV